MPAFRTSLLAGTGALLLSLQTGPVAAQIQGAVADAPPRKFCGDPSLIGDEPCLPPIWCEGPNGTYPARLDGSCHQEDFEEGPPAAAAQVQAPRPPQVPRFECDPGYDPVIMLRDGRPLCAAEFALPRTPQ